MQNIILNRTVFPPITSVILKLSVSGFFLHTIKKRQTEDITVPEKISNFPTTKTSRIVKKKHRIFQMLLKIYLKYFLNFELFGFSSFHQVIYCRWPDIKFIKKEFFSFLQRLEKILY